MRLTAPEINTTWGTGTRNYWRLVFFCHRERGEKKNRYVHSYALPPPEFKIRVIFFNMFGSSCSKDLRKKFKAMLRKN
jgi:hypothetical protein